MSNQEKCQKAATLYQSKFVHHGVLPMASRDLVRNVRNESSVLSQGAADPASSDSPGAIYTLIDVRTAAERAVSMIQGAIALDDFMAHVDTRRYSSRESIVCYCTIGYRSGLEATRLKQILSDRSNGHPVPLIYNLDGMVAMSHALSELSTSQTARSVCLIEPATGRETQRVHTFSRLWDWVELDATPSTAVRYTSTYFTTVETLGRLLQVAFKIVLRSTQTVWYQTRHCCKRFKRQRPAPP